MHSNSISLTHPFSAVELGDLGPYKWFSMCFGESFHSRLVLQRNFPAVPYKKQLNN